MKPDWLETPSVACNRCMQTQEAFSGYLIFVQSKFESMRHLGTIVVTFLSNCLENIRIDINAIICYYN